MNLQPMYPPQKDSPSTYITGDVGTNDIYVIVGSPEILPQTTPFPLTLGFDKSVTETVIVTNIAESGQLTVTRGNAPLAWMAGTKCARMFTAEDLKAVQDNVANVVEQSNNQNGAIEALEERVSELDETVGDETGGLVKGLADEIARAGLAETTEKSRAEGAESVLNQNKVNRTELQQVIADWSYGADGSAVTVTITRYNASNQTTTTYAKTFPIVDDESVGLMTPEAYNEITSLRQDVVGLSDKLSALAPLANPAFTGVPTVPTAAKGTNTTQAASTEFIQNALNSLSGITKIPADEVCELDELTDEGIYSGSFTHWALFDGSSVNVSAYKGFCAASKNSAAYDGFDSFISQMCWGIPGDSNTYAQSSAFIAVRGGLLDDDGYCDWYGWKYATFTTNYLTQNEGGNN